ncbi:PLP-dependent transferase [Aaosphaeria arxii CBS 175.79]|uniref:PLP-dependent transferase n=1 Tax=Aaosphaeria arxii CBS 175.79 TaxID=1450172 RepID=A0A6A5XBI5_9PLEO|nr:PLP-dependent transferase [Aaosphaeria arxii CBS 175.79]KAF2010259.1 PLP-dependent transferase [Aaosphaeria arxii CBS 175.79]
MEKIDDNAVLTPLARQLRLSATLEINELVQQRLQQEREVFHLGFGEATFPVHQSVAAAHRDASLTTGYLPVAGLQTLRESVARFQTRRLRSSVKTDQVVVAPGSKPLLFALFDVLQGDVLLPRPSWVSYEPQVLHAGKRLFWVETSEQNRHAISEQSLVYTYEHALRSGGKPRIMLINSPSNPTGQVFTKENVDTIVRFCEERGIILISDEIYSDIFFGDEHPASPGSLGRLDESKLILTGGLSKTYSAGGWRVGYAIFPSSEFGRTVQTAVLAYASECWSAASAPAQEAAAVAFDTTSEMDLYRAQVARLHKSCTLQMYHQLLSFGLDIAKPQGAFYLYPSFQPFARQLESLGIKTSAELSSWLITEFGVATLPGSVFGEDDDGLPSGRYRLRMATSYLYFKDCSERYEHGYDLLAMAVTEQFVPYLPLLQSAIKALQAVVDKLKAL